MLFKTKFCSSLEKVFSSREPKGCSSPSAMALRGEVISFQIAFWCNANYPFTLNVQSPLAPYITMRKVTMVPVDYLSTNLDSDTLMHEPGLAPDLLMPPKQKNSFMTVAMQWCSIWISLSVPEDAKGIYDLHFNFDFTELAPGENEFLPQPMIFTLNVIPCSLPPQTMKVTRWFHADCLASYYECKVFSEQHWNIISNFVQDAVAHGQTMLLTPLFTPPLDTQIGTYRSRVQLVDVTRTGKNVYSFNFSKLERWVKMAKSCGIKQFEMSHLFTQWGAKCTPQIWAMTDNGEERIFGWENSADSTEYEQFLTAFIPQLCNVLKQLGIAEETLFHCSDEPHQDSIEQYKKIQAMLRRHLPKEFPIMDALSHAEFCNESMTDIPVPIESAWSDFAKLPLKEKWVYYCCGPSSICPNQFIYMPSARNRILGMILYRQGIQGFLHWGYNFYNSTLSKYPVNPFLTTSGDQAFPAGDAFQVYPGKNGKPLDSIRHEVFREAMQDMRALQLLESKIGRQKINALLDKACHGEMDFQNYPRTEKQLLALREKINKLLARQTHIAQKD